MCQIPVSSKSRIRAAVESPVKNTAVPTEAAAFARFGVFLQIACESLQVVGAILYGKPQKVGNRFKDK